MAEDPWAHPNKEWRKTLQLAKELGWSPPIKRSNHKILDLKCPGDDSNHRVKVFSTGKGTEAVALRERRKIQRCQHRDLAKPVAVIKDLIQKAERLINAAEALLDQDEAASKAEELLEEANLSLNNANDSLEGEFDQWVEKEGQARATIEEMKSDGVEMGEPGVMLNDAQHQVRSADMKLREVPAAYDGYEELRSSIADCRGRVEDLRVRVAEQGRD